ncbi:polyprenol phosphomannose-dependent alpha 1,6 mannosyltransferase MptB [Corynebacterium poyangense]|uniref:polyprenol phosphomannose-dependent alpha 1,6 mannosyltransferase MptB n=1 Tax=Corynebacterium poyangense TaxID=2684405 RepID=UPI001CCF70FC|nr:polyprenol phosphomannose-dependent alpha 1,6 mannosyltransferase MptB [Corynebacterium poyangense]
MPRRTPLALQKLKATLPALGLAGSRSAFLHQESAQLEPRVSPVRPARIAGFLRWRWIGTVGSLLIGLGGLGAGALPVVDNPYASFPGGAMLARMLQTSSMMVFLGVALLVFAWVAIAPYCGISFHSKIQPLGVIPLPLFFSTFLAWTSPLFFTAPLFTQDIYSYLANGTIVVQGMDPYSAGPVDLLGTDHHLARSVPFIWAHSPSPYGPVALGLAGLISFITHDSIVFGVLCHRLISILSLVLASWALHSISRRCGVSPVTALWLSILNPLTLLHLIAGIHNESLMLGLLLAGVELALRAIDRHSNGSSLVSALLLLVAAGVLISCAGMVKVSAFLGLGFVGMCWARHIRSSFQRFRRPGVPAILCAAALQVVVLLATVSAVTMISGISTGWITGQGGAVAIRSWLSATTELGVIAGWFGMLLGLGDHTESILLITRAVGIAIAGAFAVRMLFATYRGRIHVAGALGVSLVIIVLFFPVVHPWYALWAILPLAAWANRTFFHAAVTLYSGFISFVVLPRGLGLPPITVVQIYFGFIFLSLAVFFFGRWLLTRPQNVAYTIPRD